MDGGRIAVSQLPSTPEIERNCDVVGYTPCNLADTCSRCGYYETADDLETMRRMARRERDQDILKRTREGEIILISMPSESTFTDGV